MKTTTTLQAGDTLRVSAGEVRVVKVSMRREGAGPPSPAVLLEYESSEPTATAPPAKPTPKPKPTPPVAGLGEPPVISEP